MFFIAESQVAHDLRFSPHLFLAWVSLSLDGFYTGPSSDVLQLTVFILASLIVFFHKLFSR